LLGVISLFAWSVVRRIRAEQKAVPERDCGSA
jgi:hypothetical protein